MLQYSDECLEYNKSNLDRKDLEVDHIIPLASNELNKKIREIKPQSGKKVISQSIGSNDLRNLALACKKCNSKKKHKILPELISDLKSDCLDSDIE